MQKSEVTVQYVKKGLFYGQLFNKNIVFFFKSIV